MRFDKAKKYAMFCAFCIVIWKWAGTISKYIKFIFFYRSQSEYVKKLLMRFPKLERGLLRKKYPLANVDKIDADKPPIFSDPKSVHWWQSNCVEKITLDQ